MESSLLSWCGAATLPVGFATFDALYADGTCKYTTLADGTKTKAPCPEAFGYLIGTTALCSLTSMILSFVPPKKLQKIFPPLVTGVTVLLIVSCSIFVERGNLH
jgi:xanthine/uracil permease